MEWPAKNPQQDQKLRKQEDELDLQAVAHMQDRGPDEPVIMKCCYCQGDVETRTVHGGFQAQCSKCNLAGPVVKVLDRVSTIFKNLFRES